MTVRQQIKRLIYILLYALYRRARLFVVPMLILPVVVVLQGISSEKYYVSHASVLLEESSLLNPFLDELSFSFELEDRIDALKTLVLSRDVLSEVAKNADLMPDELGVVEKDILIEKLKSNLSITVVGDELVRIHFRWNQPEKMVPVLEGVVDAFVERLLAPTKTSLDSSEQFFEVQIEHFREDLEEADDKLAEYRAAHSSELPQLFISNQEALQTIERQRQLKSVELSGVKARLDMLENKLGKANPVLGILEDKIIRAESELALLRTKYTLKHSKVAAVVREIETLKQRQREILQSPESTQDLDIDRLWQLANTLPDSGNPNEPNLLVSQIIALQEARNHYAQVIEEMTMLDLQVEELSKRLSSSSEVERQLRILERDYEVKSDLYRDMLSRYEMAKISGELVRYEGPDKVKQIERAYSPTQSTNAPFIAILLTGIVLGVVAGGLFVFVAELLDASIKDKVTVEKLTNKPVLAILPVIPVASAVSNNHYAIPSSKE
ncbi:sugar transporter [Alteromonas sp. KUL49]|nr:sugar transporter [Alteromonas sp. KUL49]